MPILEILFKKNPLATKATERQFKKARLKMLSGAVQLGALLAAILVPIFSLLDLAVKPHQFWTFLAIRSGVILIALSVHFLMKMKWARKYQYTFPIGAFLVFVVGSSISLMCHMDMGPSDPYYAGINLPLLGFGILYPTTLIETLIIVSTVWLSYFIPNLIVLQPHEVPIFVNNNFFLISTILISVVSTRFNFHYRMGQWLSHRKLQSANRKIKKHNIELEEKVQERTQKMLQSERLAVVGQLAGGVAHDFNNHLTAILGISDLLLGTLEDSDPNKKDVESIRRVGHRAANLIKQLLAFSRRQILVTQNLSLNEIIKEIEKMLNRLIGEHIKLDVHLAEDLGSVCADPVQIEQIIMNLAVNARDAMIDGGRLLIETQNVSLDKNYSSDIRLSLPAGNYVMLSVTDNGMGMDEETQMKIFEPFFTTKELGKGTGLGLSTVYGIVKQSKGGILVYSEIEHGTTFKIYLPRIKDGKQTSLNNDEVKKEIPRGNETILLVEDEEIVRNSTARMLECQGYKVYKADEGKRAIELAENMDGDIDLIVTDVIMPQMNGKAVVEHMLKKKSDLKVLYISGYTDKTIIAQGILDSDAQFLQKPYTLENLNNKIRSIFDSNGNA